MKRFIYLVKDKNNKVTKGDIEAENREGAAEALSKKGLTPIYVKSARNKINTKEFFDNLSTVSASEKVMFSKQLATLVSAGVPISQSMHILEEQTENKRLKRATKEIGQDIEAGLSLSSAMEKQEKIFGPLFANMIRAGEIGGILDQSLEKMADEIEKEHELVSSVRGAMYYPILIIIAMIGVVAYMITNIIPQFAAIFTQMGGSLPATTRFLIGLSDALRSFTGILVIVLLIAAIIGLRVLIKRSYRFRYGWHGLLLKTPIFGKLIKKINIARFTRTLGSLLNSGVAVLEALKISGDVLKNEVFKKEIADASEKVENGASLGETLKNSKIFPVIVPQMISIGEQTGSLDKILEKLTTFYQKEVDQTVKNLSSLLEPMIMIIIGFGVGFIVIAVITPMYSMMSVIN
jgi:type IV pilus assembly protein PilC